MAQMHGREKLVGQITAEEWRTGRPAGRRSWLLTTKSEEAAERVSELYQGEVVCAASGGDLYARKLHAEGIAVIVAGVANVRPRLALENERGLVHACDGLRYLHPMLDDAGAPLTPLNAGRPRGLGPDQGLMLVWSSA
ncbi:hypothetical protein [Streptomyces sp. AK010]|uniref:hypothetical protein n=1 Tax=Streptomyces sp. AK010 TaxID=2723074 RepID=UPI0016176C2C|nr:hypothetical protein [Streptomyces sp. AK010]MBB6420060.1 hypothetical protein [Streptomyces sp. AK010]